MIKRYILSSVRNKLLMIAGLGTTLVVGATIYGIYNGWSLAQEMKQVVNSGDVGFVELSSGFKTQVQEWKNVLIRGHDEKQRDKYWGKFNKKHEAVQRNADELISQAGDARVKQKLQEFKKVHEKLFPLYKKGFDAYVDSGFNHIEGDKAVKGIDREPGKLLLEIGRLMEESLTAEMQTIEQHALDGVKISVILLVSTVLVSFIIFLWMLKKIIIRPVQSVAHDLALMAQGDFSKEIIPLCNDEIGDLATSAAKLSVDMGGIVERINQSVFKLSTSAEEMAHITEQSNQSLSQQRTETEQVATAMNEMTATVHEVSQNAQLAASSAGQANAEVNIGQGVVNDAINAISKLVQQVEQASDVIHGLENDSIEIGSVLDVIKSIAEQTNLLALNAAIEAARAGEQGRGFAVVADEVRVLAQRTQTSTQEIQSMIEKVQSGAQQAVESMNQSRSQADVTRDTAARAGEVLTSITNSVTNINDMNTLIASSAEEQNSVAEEINRSVVSISQVAEVSSEGAAHTAETSEDLRNVAEELKHVISRLKI